eukprot:544649-Amphidinium_carterae.1
MSLVGREDLQGELVATIPWEILWSHVRPTWASGARLVEGVSQHRQEEAAQPQRRHTDKGSSLPGAGQAACPTMSIASSWRAVSPCTHGEGGGTLCVS